MKALISGLTLALLIVLPVLIGGGCQDGLATPGVAQRSPGELLYRARCGNCHQLRRPEQHDMAEWAYYVDKYGERMSDEQKQLVLAWLERARQDELANN